MIKLLKILPVLAVIAAVTFTVPANAQTPITSCGVIINAPGSYTVTTAISQRRTTPCITVTSIAAGQVVSIDCGGNTISGNPSALTLSSSLNGLDSLIRVYANAGTISINNCNLSGPTYNPSNGAPYVFSDGGLIVENSALTNVAIVDNCFASLSTSYNQIITNTFSDGYIYNGKCPVMISGNTLNGYPVSGPANLGVNWEAPVVIDRASFSVIGSNIITVPANNSYDDGIVLLGDSTGSVTYNSPSISFNTITGPPDLGIEFLGPWTSGSVMNNTCIDCARGIIGEYYVTGIDNFTIASNHSNSTGVYTNQTMWFFYACDSTCLYPNPGGYAPFFTNNRFRSNTLSGSSFIGSYTGGYSASFVIPFASYSGNYLQNNILGSTAYFQSVAGVSDGGGNTCVVTAPAGAVTC